MSNVPAIVITADGVYSDLQEEAYHSDPVDPLSVSASVLKLLIERSPAHARMKHPKLSPMPREESNAGALKFDRGKAAHKVLLEGKSDGIVIVEADDFKTKAARLARDDARASGKIPMLPDDYETVLAMAAAARAQLALIPDCRDTFVPGKGTPEVTLVWTEETPHGNVRCRARLDWLPEDGAVFDDHKTTATSANPSSWGQRTLWDIGAHIQAALYCRGITRLLGVNNPEFRFVVQEVEPPYCLATVSLTQQAMEAANDMVERGLDYWGWCLKHNKFPGYRRQTAFVHMPKWRDAEFIAEQTQFAIDREQQQGVDPYTWGLDFWKINAKLQPKG